MAKRLPFEGSKRRMMLDALAERDMTSVELAQLVGTDPVITAGQLRLLEGKGLCRPADGQERRFSPTNRGGSTPTLWTVKPPRKARGGP